MKIRNLITDTVREHLNESESMDYNIGDVISGSKMVDYILDNNLQDTGGEIDYNEAKEIAYASYKWTLEMVNLDNFDWVVDSDYKNKSIKAYPVVLKVDGEYEVLDGKHRIGMYNDMGIKSHLMWVGEV